MPSSDASGVSKPVHRSASAARRAIAFLCAAAVCALAIWFGVHWFSYARFQQSTDNAYVRADITLVSAKIEGYVRNVRVEDNRPVRAGDVLVEIDPADYQARVAAARASLHQARGLGAAEAAQRALASSDVNRYRPLADRGLLSPARMQQLEIEERQARSGLSAAAARVDAAAAELEIAELNLAYTTVRAPIGGVVGDRQVRVGQLVRSGTPLMAIVPLDEIYIIANFKETQVGHFRPGQPALVRPDVARSLRLRGVVDSMAPASGSQFSIIPTDTATGNFTKIVQRVPVRIRLSPEQPGLELLRPGFSATVTVDTRE